MASATAPRHRRDGSADLGLCTSRVLVVALLLVAAGAVVAVARR